MKCWNGRDQSESKPLAIQGWTNHLKTEMNVSTALYCGKAGVKESSGW